MLHARLNIDKGNLLKNVVGGRVMSVSLLVLLIIGQNFLSIRQTLRFMQSDKCTIGVIFYSRKLNKYQNTTDEIW